jgi:folylpolyglutamate synthase/dihydropteroate synthase
VQAPDLATALAQARQQAGPQIPIFITGSLFLVGEARSLLAKTSELR